VTIRTPTPKSMSQPTPPEPRARELARRYGVWVVVCVAFVAGIIFYFRYQSTLAPMLGGGK
jgi:type VI protein secretion system component VasF